MSAAAAPPAGAGAPAAAAAATPQPAAEPTDEELGLVPGESAFSAAADAVAAAVASGGARPGEAHLLRLYGFYKQATAGDCRARMPWPWRVQKFQQWRAWHRLKGMPAEKAMAKYAALAREALAAVGIDMGPADGDAGDDTTAAATRGKVAKGGGLGGPVMSRGIVYGADNDGGSSGNAAGQKRSSGTGGSGGGPKQSLHELAGADDAAALAAALGEGGSGSAVNARDADGCTPLHFAADRGALAALKLLLANGADLAAADDAGATPLHYAAMCGQRAAYEALVAAGADEAAEDADGQSARAAADWLG